eukprot:Rhum_TRINITY_DN8374_c0_g2::Rhum_TRINITY_DN8374_c0_g2_i1::g.27519::m.27519
MSGPAGYPAPPPSGLDDTSSVKVSYDPFNIDDGPLSGRWFDVSNVNGVISVSHKGSVVDVDAEIYCPWAPAHGVMDDAVSTIKWGGGLKGVTSTLDPSCDVICFSNGMTWKKEAANPDSCLPIANVAGTWDDLGTGARIVVKQTMNTFCASVPAGTADRAGLPATGYLCLGPVLHMSGTTACVDVQRDGTKTLKWEDGSSWRHVPFT